MSADPLPEPLAALIAAEREPPVDAQVEARLLARLDRSLEVAMAEPPAGAGSVPQPAGSLGVVKALGAGVSLVAAGVALHAAFAPLPEPVTVVVPVPIAVSVPAPPPPEPVVAMPEPPRASPSKRPAAQLPAETTKVEPAVEPPAESTLEAERRLLEPARTAVARGMHHQALSLLSQHAQTFDQGALAEERDALWVQALAASGDLPAARQKAEQFAARYPDSLFLPVVQRSVLP